MSNILFDYPRNAAFGRVVPKRKIYDHGKVSSAVKELFVQQIDQIIWQYKLAPETINIVETDAVAEIQIFSVRLKYGEIKPAVLGCIDAAIPFPIIFELGYEDKIKMIAAYKRPNAADRTKWVVSDYYETDWLAADSPRLPLPLVFNLEQMYGRLLEPLLPYPGREGEPLQVRVERMAAIVAKQREVEQCEKRLVREKQFNIQVEINRECRALRQALAALVGTD